MDTTFVTDKLKGYLEKLEEGATKGVDLLQEEVPLYVKELLNWMFYDAVISAGMLVFLAFITSMFALKFHKVASGQNNNWDKEPWFLLYIPVVALSIASIIMITDAAISAKKAVKVSVAPRVVVVEEITKIVNGDKK